MSRKAMWLVACLVAPAPFSWAAAGDGSPNTRVDPEAAQLFSSRIHPLLKAKCFQCHGEGEELEGDLDLRSRATMLQGGKRGPALVPGRPAESLVYQAVRRTGELAMPPKVKDQLSEAEVAAIRVWIEAGAPWVEPTSGNK